MSGKKWNREQIERRQAMVKELYAIGLTTPEMAELLSVSKPTITNDISLLRLADHGKSAQSQRLYNALSRYIELAQCDAVWLPLREVLTKYLQIDDMKIAFGIAKTTSLLGVPHYFGVIVDAYTRLFDALYVRKIKDLKLMNFSEALYTYKLFLDENFMARPHDQEQLLIQFMFVATQQIRDKQGYNLTANTRKLIDMAINHLSDDEAQVVAMFFGFDIYTHKHGTVTDNELFKRAMDKLADWKNGILSYLAAPMQDFIANEEKVMFAEIMYSEIQDRLDKWYNGRYGALYPDIVWELLTPVTESDVLDESLQSVVLAQWPVDMTRPMCMGDLLVENNTYKFDGRVMMALAAGLEDAGTLPSTWYENLTAITKF